MSKRGWAFVQRLIAGAIIAVPLVLAWHFFPLTFPWLVAFFFGATVVWTGQINDKIKP